MKETGRAKALGRAVRAIRRHKSKERIVQDRYFKEINLSEVQSQYPYKSHLLPEATDEEKALVGKLLEKRERQVKEK